MDKIRVLYFMDGIGNGGGIQEMVINWVSYFDKEKYIVDILSYDTGKNDNYRQRFEKFGGKIYIIPSFVKKGCFFKSIKETCHFFKKHHYDIIHAHASSKAFFVLNEAKKNGIKIRILHSHCTQFVNNNFKSLFVGNILKPLCNMKATHYFACSHEAGYFLFGKRKMGKKGIIINNGIELSKYKFNSEYRKEIREEFNLQDRLVIGNIGRFRPQKNHEFLINVFNDYCKINEKSVLLLCGTGELFEKMKKKVKDLGIETKVIFTGYRNDVYKLVQALDVFVMTSYFEGLPVTAVEAQAAGIPCIFSNSISQDAKINSNCEFMDLNDEISKWCETIDKVVKLGKIKNQEKMFESKYDIQQSSEHIQALYFKMIREEKEYE